MKAITLFQPYATLAVLGIKRFETRSWSTNYRGPLAIHAAKAFPRAERAFAASPAVRYALRNYAQGLPRGVVLGVCDLTAVTPTNLIVAPDLPLGLDDQIMLSQFLFGNFAPGRFAWTLANIWQLARPIPAAGFQKIWTWKAPSNLELKPLK